MLPSIKLFGKLISTYSLCAIFGIVLGLVVILFIASKEGKDKEVAISFFAFALIGAAIGAKGLYLLTNISSIIKDFSSASFFRVLDKYIRGGFVFYGGLYGAIFGAWLYGKIFKYNLNEYLDIILPSLVLFHALGRLGCLMVGCCYGVPSPFGVMFTNSNIAPNNIRLFPTQILEALWEFVTFFILITVRFIKKIRGKNLFGIYLLMYAPFRFILEFFRGDEYRGRILGLSTSQWLSILTIIVAIIIFLRPRIRKEER